MASHPPPRWSALSPAWFEFRNSGIWSCRAFPSGESASRWTPSESTCQTTPRLPHPTCAHYSAAYNGCTASTEASSHLRPSHNSPPTTRPKLDDKRKKEVGRGNFNQKIGKLANEKFPSWAWQQVKLKNCWLESCLTNIFPKLLAEIIVA